MLLLVDAVLVVSYTACYSCKVSLHNLQLLINLGYVKCHCKRSIVQPSHGVRSGMANICLKPPTPSSRQVAVMEAKIPPVQTCTV